MKKFWAVFQKKSIVLALTICLLLPLTACGNDIASRNIMDDLKDDSEIVIHQDIADANDAIAPEEANTAVTDFAVRLFQKNMQLNSGDTLQNSVLSPISVLMALSMTANGAGGDTLEQMEEVIGLPVSGLNAFAKDYLSTLPNEKDYKFSMANSIWFRDEENRLTVKPDFLTKNKAYYSADIYESAFDDSTVKDINTWIDKNTDGLIKEMLNEIPYDAVMYLINACVFDAKWQKEYNTSDIWEGTFYLESGQEQSVDMMRSDEKHYLEDDRAKGFIKYYADEKYAFVALLPNEDVGLDAYVSSLTGEHLQNMLENPTETIVHATMPKFEVAYQVEMKELLMNMGMVDAFDDSKADLSGIGTSTRGPLYISKVLHKSFITVDELGTKAGAATIVEVVYECAPIEDNSKTVILERPFLYMIIDCEYNQPLFIGTVEHVEAGK